MYESDDMVAALMADNSERRNRQKALDIRVIIGNPPYNVANTGVVYKDLNQRIADTYAAKTTATNKNSLYDSYVQAIRWASDRIGDSGVIGFVTNGGWIDGNAMDGMRKCLEEEFSSIYVFNARGNQRTSGELSRREGGKIFGSGSRAPVSISLLVKNPDSAQNGQIKYFDIGDYLTREQKLEKIKAFCSIEGVTDADLWEQIKADEHNDWINQRDKSFDEHLLIGDKKSKAEELLFETYSNGAKTNSDAWMYNASPISLTKNMKAMTDFYNEQSELYAASGKTVAFEKFVDRNPKKISWHSSTLPKASRGVVANFDDKRLAQSIYRPFEKTWLYNDKHFIQRVALMPSIFPTSTTDNRTIAVTGVGSRTFSAFMVDTLPCLDMIEKGQNFPLKLYEEADTDGDDLFASDVDDAGYREKDGITDYGLKHFHAAYSNTDVTKEDVFYYVYGLLHSAEYRTRYADNLSKQLPRIPTVKQEQDFWAFSKAGRKLGDLHVNYETVEQYPVTIAEGDLRLANISDPKSFYRVEQMRFAGKRPNLDKTTVVYNNNITMTDIPIEAYDYVVNSKPALAWVMERQRVKTDKKSGILNDANDYANETVQNSAYPLELFQRVITVSLETMKIVNGLPKLDID